MLKIDPEIFKYFKGMKIVACLVDGIYNAYMDEPKKALNDEIERIVVSVEFDHPELHPRIVPWLNAFKKMGVSPKKYPPSIMALVKAAKKGKLPSINPFVDFYNGVSLKTVLPIGAWDLDSLEDSSFKLGFAQGAEVFRPLGSSAFETAHTGEVVYFDDSEIITRYFIWKQSEKGKITIGSNRILMVSEILPECGNEAVNEVIKKFENGLHSFFDIEPKVAILPDDGLSFSL